LVGDLLSVEACDKMDFALVLGVFAGDWRATLLEHCADERKERGIREFVLRACRDFDPLRVDFS
jgi:hypothetical protein